MVTKVSRVVGVATNICSSSSRSSSSRRRRSSKKQWVVVSSSSWSICNDKKQSHETEICFVILVLCYGAKKQ